MNKLGFILNFAGSLFPFIFPDKKFNPVNLAGVVVAILLSAGLYHLFGVDGMQIITENAGDIIEASSQKE